MTQVVPILRSLKGIYLSWENKPSKVNMEETEDQRNKKQTYNAKVSVFDLLMGATTCPLPCTHVAPLQAIPSSPT